MTINETKRVLRYEDETGTTHDLADLNPEASVEEVVRMHAIVHPELATAVVEGPVLENGEQIYTAQTRLGKKG